MPITIPKRLQKKLHSDSTYEGYIHTLLNNTAALITEKADFFPEYTLHGWSHIQAVLNHADKLIPDVTLKALSGWDAAILITAVVIHDLGMFLNKAGVSKLLTGPRRTTKTDLLDKYNWKDEWDRYIREIRRYSEEKLLYHFGMSHAIEEPDLEKDKFSDLDLLIVGDFLRRHHPRIAHEIALGTMPGDTDVDVLQVGLDALGCKAFSEKDRKCIGILARSHGMPIRGTLRYIEQELGKLYQEKLSYLMTILRIADALDADQQRAPDTRRKLDGIRTPVSVKEWIWNQRITRTDLDWGKASDSKYVEAKPHSTTEYVHLENWLNWVQQELDTSWAVLSEVCDTRKFRLSIHRVESNILEEGQREFYSKKFITKEARLNANPELLKLLVGPLYDNDPSYGVRELLQNAVDACSERAHLEGTGYCGEVHIHLDTNVKTLTVSDNGIGMDENVLLNYYLSAGSSYRSSDQWFERFATDGAPDIVRTGHFGVGVLATFLLGNEVEVTTRHMEDEWGYTFKFGLEPKALDIRRPKLDEPIYPIGTTITVKLKDDAFRELWNGIEAEQIWMKWYRFKEPLVKYWVDEREYISAKPFVPRMASETKGWFELPDMGFEVALWGYPSDGFFCNGIRIPVDTREAYIINDIILPMPSISIVDKKGILEMDLPRRNVINFQLEEWIYPEVCRYALAQLLLAEWSSPDCATERLIKGIWNKHDRSSWKGCTHFPYVCGEREYAVFCVASIKRMQLDSFLKIYFSSTDDDSLVPKLQKIKPSIPVLICSSFKEKKLTKHDTFQLFSCEEIEGPKYMFLPKRLWISQEWSPSVNGIPDSAFCDHRVIAETVEYIEYADCPFDEKIHKYSVNKYWAKLKTENPFLLHQWDTKVFGAISQISVSHIRSSLFSDKYDFVGEFIDKYMNGDPWIPYDMGERRKKFPKAFEELKYYIDRILADREKERGAQNA